MKTYIEVDQHLHLICQIIAKANRTYVPKKADDSHTNLYYDSLGNRITGRWIKTSKEKIMLTLNLESQKIEIISKSGRILESFHTISMHMDAIENQIESKLPTLGLDPKGFKENLHFEIPDYSFSSEPVEQLSKEGLSLWKEYRSLANHSCLRLLGHAQFSEEIRIWPHHFDTGIYFKANNDLGVGFGLAVKDSMVGAPYFYMSAYPEGRQIDYDNVSKSGIWKWEIGEDWKGAILELNKLTELSGIDKKNAVDEYLTSAYSWYISQ